MTGNCRQGLPYPDCQVENRDPKCVKIKFHFINNTNDASTPEREIDYATTLDRLNFEYKDSKISFTFGDECMHFGSIPISGTTGPSMLELLTDSTGNLDPDSALGYVDDYLNVYFMQEIIGSNYGFYSVSAAVIQPNCPIQVLAHEVGHLLGLGHTHSGPINLNFPQTWDCLCKDTTALNDSTQILHCRITEDCLCDTGIDPWALDIDFPKDSLPDKHKWVSQGQQVSSLPPLFPDWCNDTITAWDIPGSNYMSYYDFAYRNTFSPCQNALMHDVLDSLIPNMLIVCDSHNPALACDDIVIDGAVIWEDTMIIMCRNQRIIIEKTGSLHVYNTTITVNEGPEPPSLQCPDLVSQHLWDGIYIEGRIVVQIDDEPITMGSLTIADNSILEYALHGIQAPVRFGNILVENSSIRNCGSILNVRDTWPFSFAEEEESVYYFDADEDILSSCGWSMGNPPSSVQIIDSDLSCNDLNLFEFRPKSQIKISGARLNIDNSTFNNQTDSDLIAINQARGRVSMVNGSQINNFQFGILKGPDIFTPCFPRGLVVTNSSLLNCGTGVSSTSSALSIRHNYLNSRITSNGLCYQNIYGNKLISTILVSNAPVESSVFSENYLDDASVQIILDNTNTNITCNTWKSSYAVDIQEAPGQDTTILPPSWGSVLTSSGNMRTLDYSTDMSNYEQFDTNFYHYVRINNLTEQFQYIGDIEGKDSDQSRVCSYNEFPDTIPLHDPEWTAFSSDMELLDDLYQQYDSIITQLEYDYNQQSGQTARETLEILYQEMIGQGSITGEALLYLDQADTIIATTWLSRSNFGIGHLSSLYILWYKQAYNQILDSLQSESSEDAQIFSNAVNFMKENYHTGKSIFHLSEIELDSLSFFAESSFGNHTNLLRGFLSSEYDIYIPWPEQIIQRSSGRETNTKSQVPKTAFVVYPNPSKDGCLTIKNRLNQTELINVTFYSLQGQTLFEQLIFTGQTVCMPNVAPGLYMLCIQDRVSGTMETQLINLHMQVK